MLLGYTLFGDKYFKTMWQTTNFKYRNVFSIVPRVFLENKRRVSSYVIYVLNISWNGATRVTNCTYAVHRGRKKREYKYANKIWKAKFTVKE